MIFSEVIDMTKKIYTKILFAAVLMTAAILLLSACEPGKYTTTPSSTTSDGGTYAEYSFDIGKEVKTLGFEDDNELLNFLRDNTNKGYYNGYGYMTKSVGMAREMIDVDMADGMPAPTMASGTGIEEASMDFSETNVQVEGVDEADMIKTDGNYIYTISENIVYIIKAYPGEDAKIVSTIKLDNNPSGLFVNKDKLAVFGTSYDYSYFEKLDITPYSGMSYFKIYDISEKDDPEEIKEYQFEGNYFRGRMKGDYVYFITTTYPQYQVNHPRPILFDGGVMKTMPIDSIYYYDIDYKNPMYVIINSISMEDVEDDNSDAVLVEGSQEMYMSHDNIYITYSEYISEYDLQKQIVMEMLEDNLTSREQNLIEKIKVTDNEVLSRWEKDEKIWQIYEQHVMVMSQEDRDNMQDEAEELLQKKLNETEYFEYTVINRIAIEDGEISPEANGKVGGSIVNQFSMDEYNSVFRIATTVSQRWSSYSSFSESMNNVYTLDEDLEVLDQIEGLAKGEQIYSTRFIMGRLYMVTFRQVDPFFVIDLSDARNIKELGKLKIPGFSRYLHPYDANTIIGIGQDATETGRTSGLKISLFDVSDVSEPEEIAKYVTEERYAQSSALYEHKAFLFSKDKELLVIPVYNYNWEKSSENYNGAFVFKISKDEITLRGLIDHSNTTQYYWQPAVERSLFIEDMLYTKSLKLLRINRLDTLQKVKNVELNEPTTKIPVY